MLARVTSRGLPVVLASLKALPEKIEQAGARGMKRGLEAAVTIAQREFLSGPRPEKLDVVTRRLRNAMSYLVRKVPGRGVVGKFGNNVKYARYHEFGFHGSVSVRAHERLVRGLQGGAGKPADQVFRFVKAHRRRVDYAGRPFAAPALKKALPIILREVKSELAKTK